MTTERYALGIVACAKCGGGEFETTLREIGEAAQEGELRCASCGHPSTIEKQVVLLPGA
jgi:ribosomal protein L37AE/L43A